MQKYFSDEIMKVEFILQVKVAIKAQIIQNVWSICL